MITCVFCGETIIGTTFVEYLDDLYHTECWAERESALDEQRYFDWYLNEEAL